MSTKSIASNFVSQFLKPLGTDMEKVARLRKRQEMQE